MSATTDKQQLGKGFRIALIAVVVLAGLYALYTFVVAPLLLGDDLAAEVPVAAAAGAPETAATDQPIDVAAAEAATPGADGDVAAAAEVAAAAADDTAAQPADAGPAEEAPLPETFEVFTARDPFQQLVTPETEQTSGAEQSKAGTQVATATPTSTAAAAAAPSTAATGAETPEAQTGVPATRVGETVVRIQDVTTGTDGVARASVSVNGAGYTAAQGETFATSFKVLDITGQCATLLYGDSRFSLCAGEEIRK